MHIHIEYCAINQFAEFFINDIPVDRLGSDHRTEGHRCIDEYLTSGTNSIYATGSPLTAVKDIVNHEAREAPRLAASAISYPDGAEVGDGSGTTLCAISWNGQPNGLRKSVLTHDHRATFHLDSPFGRWTWEDAPVVDITTATRDEVFAYIKEIHTSIGTGSLDHYHQEGEIRTQDRLRCNPDLDIQQEYDTVRALVEAQHVIGQWELRPIAPERLILRSCAYGRMIDVRYLHEDSPFPGSPFQSIANDALGSMNFNIMVSKIDGDWKIVR